MFEYVLFRLVEHRHLTMAVACGLGRVAYTHPCSSLGMANLRTATFCLHIVGMTAAEQGDEAALRLYASSAVNLVQLIPEVTAVQYAEDKLRIMCCCRA